jgi:3'-phosphoadenosine 5'-phosphosulfate sulfotransferase (PAPS reductase)/FAD synthetase
MLNLSEFDRITCKVQNLSEEGLNEAVKTESDRIREVLRMFKQVGDENFPGLYIATSGGKDSVTVQYLVQNYFVRGDRIPVVHTPKPLTSVVQSTRTFLYESGQPMLYIPSDKMADYPDLKTQFDGTRRAEFNRSNGRSTDVVVDGRNVSREHMPAIIRNGLFGLNMVYPILEWSDLEVWSFIFNRDIPYTKEYHEQQ